LDDSTGYPSDYSASKTPDLGDLLCPIRPFAYRKPDTLSRVENVSAPKKGSTGDLRKVARPIMHIDLGVRRSGGPATTRLRLRSRPLRCRLAAGAARALRSGFQLCLADRLSFLLCNLGHVFSLSFAQLMSAQKTNRNYFEEMKLCPND
jgi:hypothetical protein